MVGRRSFWAIAVAGLVTYCSGTALLAEEIPLWGEAAAPLPAGATAPTEPEVVTGEGRPEDGGPNRWVKGTITPSVTPHCANATRRSGAAMVVCPGGGYAGMAFDKEGENISQWLAERGITAFTLKYRHGGGPHQQPVPHWDVQRAMRWVRAHAADYCIEPDQVGVIGFSAGGHLASTIGTHYDAGDAASDDAVERQHSRPDFLALIYPVITMEEGFSHGGSRLNLLGESPDPDTVAKYSNDLQVTAETPPTFIVHTTDDGTVPVENALRFYRALVTNKVPAELHIYNEGGHGYGMLQRGLPVDEWPAAFEAWLKSRGLTR